MTTAALANENIGGVDNINQTSNDNNSTPAAAAAPTTTTTNTEKAKQVVSSLTQHTSRAIGNLLPTATLQSLTTRKYTLPDKTVASQVLMYRQLLHTNAKPGLKLSRPYQGTAAQKAVLHMPWWEQGIEDSGKMIISYDNLLVRLWLHGAIMPYFNEDLLGSSSEMETLIDEKGLPPVPHPYWVERLGFQQQDPVTDFRSGGVLSLAMMVFMVESCPHVCQRFNSNSGDVAVLPFGITCINVTDMLAKFLMLAKSVDRMDALLSQKPFWRMFADPNAILALQELCMSMLCDVVVELKRERKIPGHDTKTDNLHGEQDGNVTVFDFPMILETTERRIRNDLLGAGPKSVDELRSIAGRLRVKYQTQLEQKEKRAMDVQQQVQQQPPPSQQQEQQQPRQGTGQILLGNASIMAVGMVSKLKAAAATPNWKNPLRQSQSNPTDDESSSPPRAPPIAAFPPDLLGANSPPDQSQTQANNDEGSWTSDMMTADDMAHAVSHFSIDGDDDEDI